MASTSSTTTIRIKLDTKRELDEIGKKNESYDDIIRRLIEYYKQSDSSEKDNIVKTKTTKEELENVGEGERVGKKANEIKEKGSEASERDEQPAGPPDEFKKLIRKKIPYWGSP